MMITMESEDWQELIHILDTIDEQIASSNGGGISSEARDFSRQMLQSFHTTAAMFGLEDLERAGITLERHIMKAVQDEETWDSEMFLRAVETVRREMAGTVLEGYESLRLADRISRELEEVQQTGTEEPVSSTSFRPMAENNDRNAPADGGQLHEGDPNGTAENLDYEVLNSLVHELGGELIFSSDTSAAEQGYFYLRFQAEPERLQRIQTVLSFCCSGAPPSIQLELHDARIDRIFRSIKDFMRSLSEGDLRQAQTILQNFSEKKENSTELFVEIGTLARDLHSSLKGFMTSIDPALKDLVEERLPDSGSRLEHILHLTENAANTTLDHVELMKKRHDGDLEKLAMLQQMHAQLKAIGDNARSRLADCETILEELKESNSRSSEDLVTILTAQDYQDLTGQIIIKIINLLNELQLKLVNLVRTFGPIHEERKTPGKDELYGPAHQGKIEALHSQDDVDNLLAEFGF